MNFTSIGHPIYIIFLISFLNFLKIFLNKKKIIFFINHTHKKSLKKKLILHEHILIFLLFFILFFFNYKINYTFGIFKQLKILYSASRSCSRQFTYKKLLMHKQQRCTYIIKRRTTTMSI